MTPGTLLALANLGRPRRPSGARAPVAERALSDVATASQQLGALLPDRVAEADLPGLRTLRRLAVEATDALRGGATPDPRELNSLARHSHAHARLVVDDGELRRDLAWEDRSVVGYLARILIEELAVLEPDRLRECARPECTLLFYDTTRSRTRRWHAEDPCGWRERQRIRRAAAEFPDA